MRESRREVLTHGFVAGLVGYAVVAVFFIVWNVIAGRSPFYTPAALGAALFYGLEDPAELVVWAGPVLAFNGAQLLAFLGAGVIVAWLATQSERGYLLWYVGLSLFLFGIVHVLGLLFWIGEPFRELISPASIIIATLLAAAAMAAYLLGVHPRLRRQMRRYRDAA